MWENCLQFYRRDRNGGRSDTYRWPSEQDSIVVHRALARGRTIGVPAASSKARVQGGIQLALTPWEADCHRHIRPRTLPVTHGQDGNDRSVENTNIFSKLSSADVGSASALGAQAGLCSSCRSATSIKPEPSHGGV